MSTSALDQGDKFKLVWPESFHIKIQPNADITFQIVDEGNDEKVVLKYKTTSDTFKRTKGSLELFMIDDNTCPKGEIAFDF